MVIELRVVQFWSEIILVLVISNRTRAARSFDFDITPMISDQIALHSVQLPFIIMTVKTYYGCQMDPYPAKAGASNVTQEALIKANKSVTSVIHTK